MKSYRLLSIIITLLNKNRVTAKELAEKLEVSPRTIQRDVEDINMAGIPIVSHKGQQGGYEILENYKLSNKLVTKDELEILDAMVSGLKSVYNNKILRELYDKIENLNKGSNGNTVRKLEIDLSPWTTSKDFERIFDLISKAIINRTLLSISYTDGNGVTTKRKVEPHKIVLKQNRWYLIGYCLNKEDVRLFKLNRIREIKELDAKFEERDIDFDFSASLRVMDSERKVLKFKNEAYSRAIDYFNEEEIEFCEEQFFYVITYIKDDGWLIATILSFGDMVEVVQPPALRKKIAEKIGSMKEIY